MAGEKLICFDFDDTLVNGHFHGTLQHAGVQPNTAHPGVQVLQANGSFLRSELTEQGTHRPTENVAQNKGATPARIANMIASIGLKDPQNVANAIKLAIDNGHKVAITSFTLFPEVAVPTLKAIMSSIMTPEEAASYVKQICVVGGYPTNNATNHRLYDQNGKVMRDNNAQEMLNPDFKGKEEHIQAAISHFRQQGVKLNRQDAILVDDSNPNIRIASRKGPVAEVTPGNNYFSAINSHIAVNLRNTVNAQPVRQQPKAPPRNPMGQLPPAPTVQQAPPVASPRAPTPQTAPNTPVAASRPLTAQEIVKRKGKPPTPNINQQSSPIQTNQFQKIPPPPPSVKQTEAPSLNYDAKEINLNVVLGFSAQNLSDRYQQFNSEKHKNDKGMHSLFNMAKSAAKHVNGTINLREQQIKELHTVFSTLKADTIVTPEIKAVLAYAHLENIKSTLGAHSGMKDLCNELQNKINNFVPGTKETFIKDQQDQKSLSKMAEVLSKGPPPPPESKGNKLK